jgi:hypothetical protein
MAAHSACAICGSIVTVRRAPLGRVQAARRPGLACTRALARRRARPRRASPAPTSALASLTWPRPGIRRDAHLAGRAPRRTSAFAHACKRAAGHINSRYQLHMITARPSPDNCFTGMDLYQSGSPPEGPDRPLPGD